MYRHAIATKEEADNLFEINLKRCATHYGFNELLITPMVAAVKMFGKGAYP